MANPIVDNIYFLVEEETQLQEQRSEYLSKSGEGYSREQHHHHYHHHLLRHHKLQKDVPSSDNLTGSAEDTSRWQSFLRRMSVSKQRDDRHTEDTNKSTHQNANYASDIGIPGDHEDDNLPSLEEVVKGAQTAGLAELKSNYFEHPFESDNSGNSSLHPSEIQDENIAPWETPRNSLTIETSRPQDTTGDHEPRKDVVLSMSHLQSSLTEQSANDDHMHGSSLANAAQGNISRPKVDASDLADPASHLPVALTEEKGCVSPSTIFSSLSVTILEPLSTEQWAFRIELYYQDIRWIVKRQLMDFFYLHMSLWTSGLIRHMETPPSFPHQVTLICKAMLSPFRLSWDDDDDDSSHWLDVSTKQRGALEKYLRDLIQRSATTVNFALCEFLEISAISITRDMGWKGKEGYMERKVKPVAEPALQFLRRSNWVKKWVILRDSYVAFCNDIGSTSPSDVFLFDKDFSVQRSHRLFASSAHQTHITLSNSVRRVTLKGPTGREVDEWMESFKKVRAGSPWTINHRYGSFAPVRENVKVKWFVDGQEYFEAAAEAILCAKSEIFIEDWWLSPELYLRRPPKGNEEYRIDRILKRKAMEGVKIYIVIYKNISVALPLDSKHTKAWFQGVHPNITVLRHANITTSPLWAHHEKILVIDHRLAFIGGLDLCFGRYDTPAHELTDYSAGDPDNPEIFPGQDYSNPRIKDFIKVSHYELETVDKKTVPRMPWHDIHTAMVGPPARDVARHFIQRWNFIKSTTRAKERSDVPFLMPKGEYVSARDEAKFRGTCRVQVIRSSAEWSQGIPREFSIYNAYVECIQRARQFIYIENQFFITSTNPKDRTINNKIGQAIVDRIKRAHIEKKKFRVIVVIPAAPGFEGDFTNPDRRSMTLRSVAHFQYLSISRGGNSVLDQLKKADIPAEEYIGFFSLRNWSRLKSSSSLLQSPRESTLLEESPYDSMATIVGGNSFAAFPTGFEATNTHVENSSHTKGLTKSNSKTKKPKGWPGASGQPKVNTSGTFTSGSSTAVQSAISSSNADWGDGRLDYVTEQIYIHSKLMIVDDKTVICGSANLNDRSQLGNRDSEIAVVIEDKDLVESRMNRQTHYAARFAMTLRMRLFREHLGYQGADQDMDPLDDDFYFMQWCKTAQNNTEIYRSIFRCVPDDTVTTFEENRQFVPDPLRVQAGHIAEPWKMTNEYVQSQLEGIQGHLVMFATNYLCHENMTASIVQNAVPYNVFT